jgi:hypothetical protein
VPLYLVFHLDVRAAGGYPRDVPRLPDLVRRVEEEVGLPMLVGSAFLFYFRFHFHDFVFVPFAVHFIRGGERGDNWTKYCVRRNHLEYIYIAGGKWTFRARI